MQPPAAPLGINASVPISANLRRVERRQWWLASGHHLLSCQQAPMQRYWGALNRSRASELSHTLENVAAGKPREILATALEVTANAAVIADQTEVVIWLNPTFEELTGYAHAEIVGTRRWIVGPGRVSNSIDDRQIVVGAPHRSGSRLWQRNLAVHSLLLFVMLCATSGAAQESPQTELGGRSMEDLAKMKVDSVYGASKFLQKAADSPTSVTVVTAEEIQKHSYRSLADVLRSVHGFYVINDRNYSYVGVRGFSRPGDYNARILFLLDGHRVNDNIFDGAYVGTEFPVDVDLIERIEIIRGPNSSIYGTGAFAAVINVITKRGRDLNAIELSTAAGSWNTYKGRVSYGRRFDNGLETLLSGSFYDSQGHTRLFFPEFDSPATNNGIAENADGDRAYRIFADFIYRDFNIHFVDASRTKHIPTASFGTVFDDPRTQTTEARRYIDMQYHHTFGSWETLARASYDWYDYHGIYVTDYAKTGIPPFTQNYDAANGAWWDFQGDASRVFFKRHQITLGGEFRQDVRQEQINYDIQPHRLFFDDHRSSRIWGLYVQDEYSIHKNLDVVGGLRGDWNQFGTTLSPRIGVRVTPLPNTDVKVTYSRAFRAPNSFEDFYTGNMSNTPDPTLKPEKIRTWELDLEHRFGKTYSVSVAGFLNRVQDLIEQSIDPLTGSPSYFNAGPVHTKGMEFELGAKWPGGLEAALTYSLQNSRNLATGDVLTNSPKQLAGMNLSVPMFQKKLFASVDAQYVSERRTIAQTELGGFLVMNLTFFSRNIARKFDLSGGLYNLFDKRYADSGGLEHVEASIPQDGRSFRIKLTYRVHVNSK
jgi:iron complex outermembrane receptor protein